MNSVWDSYVGGQDFKGREWKWDPLKLSETYEPLVPFFREAELRHGRTAMLAVVGFIATDFVRLPGEAFSFESIPTTVGAHDALTSTALQQVASEFIDSTRPVLSFLNADIDAFSS